MQIEIIKYSDKKEQTDFVKIESYTNTIETSNLLLVKEFTTEELGENVLNLEIKKIQFIATCRTKFPHELLVAFYIDENGYLLGHILSELPSEYFAPVGLLIDYKSYSDLCELTGEKKLPLHQYYEHLKGGYIGKNTYAKFRGQFLNYDQQQDTMRQ